MKTKKMLVLMGALCLINMITTHVSAQLATNVVWYVLPTTLPDTTTPEFGTARDNWLTPLSMGVSPSTGSRVGNVTAIEVRDAFDVSDMCIATNAGLKLWRGVFNPTEPYTNMTGSRIYGTAIGVAQDGQISLEKVSYRVLCDRVPLLNNQSSFSGLPYSVSRIGIRRGPSGVLFAPDNQILKNGEPGTDLVDAVVLIGGRIGANANNQSDIDAINTQVTPIGARLNFEYYFNGGSKGGGSAMLYPTGSIPNNTNRLAFFKTPNGLLFSVVGPAGSAAITLESARDARGPWSLETTTATEGSSVFLKFTRNPTNDVGFVRGNEKIVPVNPQ